MNKCVRILGIVISVILFLPVVANAQSAAESIHSMQSVLDRLYADMLPKCDRLISIGRSIAGFGASWYIAYRVWGHIARAEPVDFFPLLRPFALGLAILLWPQVIGLVNGVLEPTVTGTNQLVNNTNKSVEELMVQRDKELKETAKYKMLVGEDGTGDRDLWMKYYHADEIGKESLWGLPNSISFIMDKMNFNFRNFIKSIISIILQIIYEAAALCINTLRTFNLLILAILGPLVLGFAVFDGFQHILQVYFARYINIYLWLPIANILAVLLGTIQENMIKMDIKQIQDYAGETFFTSYDLGYIIFMIIGILCYLHVPGIADMVLFVGGGNSMQQRITNMTQGGMYMAASGATGGAVGFAKDALSSDSGRMSNGMAAGYSGDYIPSGNPNQYSKGKLSG